MKRSTVAILATIFAILTALPILLVAVWLFCALSESRELSIRVNLYFPKTDTKRGHKTTHFTQPASFIVELNATSSEKHKTIIIFGN